MVTSNSASRFPPVFEGLRLSMTNRLYCTKVGDAEGDGVLQSTEGKHRHEAE